jgi:Cu+-exporting ATPase
MRLIAEEIIHEKDTSTVPACAHCGEPCDNEIIQKDDLPFCCNGCATVYTVLADKDMPGGANIFAPTKDEWAYLEDEGIQRLLHRFDDGKTAKVVFDLPDVHCSSCLQILERLPALHTGVVTSRLNFPKKQLTMTYDKSQLDLRQVAEILDFVGYPPRIHMSSVEEVGSRPSNKRLLMQIGVAGFVFGNVMLMSFPVYFDLQDLMFERLFGYLSLALCIPLLTYSASDYLRSAYTALLHRSVNIDVPISIGAMTLFLRSTYEVLSHSGGGYFDSLSGFIFFLLIGKYIQQRTYDSISFNNSYQHYFPLHAAILINDRLSYKPLKEVKEGDQLFIKGGELIPCDGILTSTSARIDYSFVTGEERAVKASFREGVFAGGRNAGEPINITALKSVDQSYLSSLWEEDAFKGEKIIDRSSFIDKVGRSFTFIILGIAAITLGYWLWKDPSMAMHAFTSVLIIACPCVLALSTPFTYGTMRALLSKAGIYFRNTQTLELLRKTTCIVFDKTGTLTSDKNAEIQFTGDLTSNEHEAIRTLAGYSNHPLSRSIADSGQESSSTIDRFVEKTGLGIQGWVEDDFVRLGSSAFLEIQDPELAQASLVHVEINGTYRGYFDVRTPLRTGVHEMISAMSEDYPIYLLSGDNDMQASWLNRKLGLAMERMFFKQSPFDKMRYIKKLQSNQEHVLMIGDGLNDAGAFRQSDISMVITDDLNNFTPASDAIITAKRLPILGKIIDLSKDLKWILNTMYAFAILYNGIGLWFAVQGLLSPVVAAILMPISSVSIVIIGTLLTQLVFRKHVSSAVSV